MSCCVQDVGVNSVYAAGWGVLSSLAAEYDTVLAAQCRSALIGALRSPHDRVRLTDELLLT